MSEGGALRAGRLTVLLLAVGSVLGCASAGLVSPGEPGEPGEPGAPVQPSLTADAAATSAPQAPLRQSLYRLTHDGGGGRTSLKVVLRESASGRFQLTFSDIAGRRVWSLDHAPNRVVLVDHRAETYCVSGPSLRLPEVHPEELPLAAVPEVLAGRFPVAGVIDSTKLTDGGHDVVDAGGHRWRAVVGGGVLAGWTLFDEGGPSLWWAREDEGGILSRRGGEQFRWRLSVSEETAARLTDMVPDAYGEGTCNE